MPSRSPATSLHLGAVTQLGCCSLLCHFSATAQGWKEHPAALSLLACPFPESPQQTQPGPAILGPCCLRAARSELQGHHHCRLGLCSSPQLKESPLPYATGVQLLPVVKSQALQTPI